MTGLHGAVTGIIQDRLLYLLISLCYVETPVNILRPTSNIEELNLERKIYIYMYICTYEKSSQVAAAM